ncbi:Type-1 restriction enzyme EcoKI specificity protein [Dolichospermum sp. UHCC 0315A]|uniref:restriction endonuclease subunit S n=1 Tax=Dolichospermum sp. UHCC 0315A TaxID=1914871 RepID=UPI00125151F2|nr:restriction endonuclease subunit S [Dolichospermum sp. UHCC 0315A]QEI39885.1 Type-1 restriction enzyme EcoKI specificity protein [Dolichospermum sp. UHCC 0315A]
MMSSGEMELMVDNRQLPVGWEIKKLGEVYDVRDGTHDSPKYLPEGYALITSKNLKSNGLNFENIKYISEVDYKKINERSAVHKGDILLAMIGTIGNPIVVEVEPEFAIKNVALIKVSKKQSSYFLKYYLETEYVRSKMQREAKGTTQKFVGLGYLRDFPIPIPPLPEQKRIVAIADEAFEGIDRAIRNTEKNLSNARELFESYLNSKLLPIVSSNLTQTLSSVTDLIVDCEHKTAPTQETGIPSIRTPNIGKGYLIFDNVNRVSEEIYELWTRRAKPEPGDLILAREAPAGNVGVIPEGYKVCLGQRTVLIRPNKKSVDSQYLAFLLLHPLMQKRLLAKSTGATVQHVNMKDIRELAINELPPIQTQRDCIEDLKQLESQSNRLESIYRQKIAALKELKQSILQKAFTGELTADKGEK